MAKGEQRSNREAKKPKKEKIKVIAGCAEPKDRWMAADPKYRQEEIDTASADAASART